MHISEFHVVNFKLFKDVKIAFTPFNLPPAFVYTCTKKNPLH